MLCPRQGANCCYIDNVKLLQDLIKMTCVPFKQNPVPQFFIFTILISGDGNKFDGGWAIESSSAGGPDLGLVVKDKAKHHAISAKLAKPVDFKELHADNKPLVIQYEVG